jgi:hypothetical protein
MGTKFMHDFPSIILNQDRRSPLLKIMTKHQNSPTTAGGASVHSKATHKVTEQPKVTNSRALEGTVSKNMCTYRDETCFHQRLAHPQVIREQQSRRTETEA